MIFVTVKDSHINNDCGRPTASDILYCESLSIFVARSSETEMRHIMRSSEASLGHITESHDVHYCPRLRRYLHMINH